MREAPVGAGCLLSLLLVTRIFMNVRFEWDAAKAARNWRDDGVTFKQALKANRGSVRG